MSRYQRRAAQPLQVGGGPSGSLGAPGATTVGVNPSTTAQQLMEALGVTGRLVGAAGEYAANLHAEERRRREEIRGEAAQAAAESAATLDAEIAQGKIDVPMNPTELQGWAEGLVTARLPQGTPESYAKEYRDRLVRSTLNAGATYQTRRFEQNRDAGIAAIANGVVGVTDGKRFADAAGELVNNWKLNPLEAKSVLFSKAANAAIETGDGHALATAIGFAGLDLKGEQAVAISAFERKEKQEQAKAVDAFKNDIASKYNDGQGFEAIRAQIARYRGTIPEDVIEQENHSLQIRENQTATEALRKQVEAAKQAADTAFAAKNDSLVRAGLGALITDEKKKLPNDTEHALSRQRRLDEAMDRAFLQIQNSPLAPEQKFDAQIRFASDNGYQPPAWKRVMEAGAIAATESALTNGEPFPPAVLTGLAFYRQLKAKSPELLAGMVDERTTKFYELALAAQEDSRVGATETTSDEQALLAAARATVTPVVISDTLNKQIIESALSITDGWISNAHNSPLVAGMIARQARLYVALGTSPDRAVARAQSQVAARLVNVNGSMVDTSDARVPAAMRDGLPKALGGFIQKWLSAHGDETGFGDADVTVHYNTSNGVWLLTDENGIPLPNYGKPETTSTTTAKLVSDWTKQLEAKGEDRFAAAKQRAIDRFIQSGRYTPGPRGPQGAVGPVGPRPTTKDIPTDLPVTGPAGAAGPAGNAGYGR